MGRRCASGSAATGGPCASNVGACCLLATSERPETGPDGSALSGNNESAGVGGRRCEIGEGPLFGSRWGKVVSHETGFVARQECHLERGEWTRQSGACPL